VYTDDHVIIGIKIMDSNDMQRKPMNKDYIYNTQKENSGDISDANHRLPTAEARFQPQDSPCGTLCAHSCIGEDISLSTSISPGQLSFYHYSSLSSGAGTIGSFAAQVLKVQPYPASRVTRKKTMPFLAKYLILADYV
jgi:hypothetical protein